MTEVGAIARLEIHEGKLEEFKRLAAPQAGERDPRADLEGQMMLDPMTRTYLGG